MAAATEAGQFPNFDRAYDPADLATLLDTDAWQALVPNRLVGSDLPPQALSTTQLELLVDDFAGSEPILPAASFRQIAGLGILTQHMPTKPEVANYQLTTPEAKFIGVRLGPRQSDLGLEVPANPRLTRISRQTGEDRWLYSDLRTYLCLPLTNNYGLSLVEFATNAVVADLRLFGMAATRALRYIRASDQQLAVGEDVTRELEQRAAYAYKIGHFMPVVRGIEVIGRGADV